MIDPELRKRVDALNEKFAEFGFNPQGELKFKWAHTTELHYFVLSIKPESEWNAVGSIDKTVRGFRCPACNHLTRENSRYGDVGGCERCDTVLGIETFEETTESVPLLLTPTYGFTRHEWAGPLGERWNLAYWQKPVSYDEWVASGREAFPWPKHGEYLCVENVAPRGAEPTELETMAAVDGIRFQFALFGPTYTFDRNSDHPKLREFIAQQARKREEHDEAISRQLAEDFDNDLPAFLKVPGENSWGVSLPRTETQIKREGGTPLLSEFGEKTNRPEVA